MSQVEVKDATSDAGASPFSVVPLSGTLGAEVRDVRLDELDDTGFAAFAALLWEHQMLVVPGQHLAPGVHKEFGQRFGELHSHPAAPGVDGHPEILLLINRGKPANITEVWHSDVSCEAEPPSISILQAKELPSAGGDTMWASQYEAYDRLSDGMKEMLEPLDAVHSAFGLESVHPVVRKHPMTGRKALYVNGGFTQRFAGMTKEESRPLLDYLVTHGSQPDLTIRHRWNVGDVVLWDNRCVMHYAIHDYADDPREMHRVTVRGERPAR